MITKVNPNMRMIKSSPIKAVSGPLRALNVIGALPLRFDQDVDGKTLVRHRI